MSLYTSKSKIVNKIKFSKHCIRVHLEYLGMKIATESNKQFVFAHSLQKLALHFIYHCI